MTPLLLILAHEPTPVLHHYMRKSALSLVNDGAKAATKHTQPPSTVEKQLIKRRAQELSPIVLWACTQSWREGSSGEEKNADANNPKAEEKRRIQKLLKCTRLLQVHDSRIKKPSSNKSRIHMLDQ
jgi:hypothetical protein